MFNIKRNFNTHIAFKSQLGIVLLFLTFTIFIAFIGNREVSKALKEQYEAGAFRTARYAAQLINPDKIPWYVANGDKTKDYQEVWNDLDQLCNSQDATFIYVIIPDQPDYGHIFFLFSTINKNSHYTHYEFGYYRPTTNLEYREKYKALYEEGSTSELVTRDKGYIETDPHITAMLPLVGSDHKTKGILCVQRQMDTLERARKAFVRKVFLITSIMAIIVMIAQGLYLNRMLIVPIKTINNEAGRFAKENSKPKKALADQIHNRDEIGRLAKSIDSMEMQVQDYIENLTKVTADKERIETELNLAAKIQADMLPNIFPAFPDRSEIDIHASMIPAKEVGGDFYDFFLIDQDHLALVMADVSGKGIPAALFMMMSKIMIENHAMEQKSPAKILQDINTQVCRNNREEMFITVWLGILDLKTGLLTAANAGHEYPIFKKPDGRFEVFKDRHGFVIGGMDGIRYKDYTIQMEPGSKLFVYTDGIPEATGPQDELFGLDRTLEALNENPQLPPEELLRSVDWAVRVFVSGEPQFDDMTMMCISYLGNPSA